MIVLKSKEEIAKMQHCNAIVAELLAEVEERVGPGAKTDELDAFAEQFITERGGKPAFKGYKGFPSSICCSINDVIVHGIPNGSRLESGDIVSIDIGVFKDGFFGDSARTFAVGEIDADAKKLLEVTETALEKSIEQVRAGNFLQDISWAVQNYVEKHGFSVVRDFVGHGIGRELHEDPPVPNFGEPGIGPKLKEGMVLAIEPMVNEGSSDVTIDSDGWTARTKDGRRSAHFEHSVAVTKNGPMILSKLAN